MLKLDDLIQRNPSILEDENYPIVRDIYREHYRSKKNRLVSDVDFIPNNEYLHLKESLSDDDKDVMFTIYRNIWRREGYNGIGLLKLEEAEYRNRNKKLYLRRKYNEMPKRVLLSKIEKWFIIRWVEENSDWADNPDSIRSYKSYMELDIESRGMSDYSSEESDLDAVGGEIDAWSNIGDNY